MAPCTEVMEMVTDVLVLGGGPAATWAGVAAAESGASVILVGKGMSGQAA
jgi:succinate dehydrogenase/fumarate reductase flavoprotein subunit